MVDTHADNPCSLPHLLNASSEILREKENHRNIFVQHDQQVCFAIVQFVSGFVSSVQLCHKTKHANSFPSQAVQEIFS